MVSGVGRTVEKQVQEEQGTLLKAYVSTDDLKDGVLVDTKIMDQNRSSTMDAFEIQN